MLASGTVVWLQLASSKHKSSLVYHLGQSSDVLLKEVAAPISEVSLTHWRRNQGGGGGGLQPPCILHRGGWGGGGGAEPPFEITDLRTYVQW